MHIDILENWLLDIYDIHICNSSEERYRQTDKGAVIAQSWATGLY
jgi:hypothetical protein